MSLLRHLMNPVDDDIMDDASSRRLMPLNIEMSDSKFDNENQSKNVFNGQIQGRNWDRMGTSNELQVSDNRLKLAVTLSWVVNWSLFLIKT